MLDRFESVRNLLEFAYRYQRQDFSDFINASDADGDTAIHCAVMQHGDNNRVIEELIKYGADLNVVNNERLTPLLTAIDSINVEICKLLVDNNARVGDLGKGVEPANIYAFKVTGPSHGEIVNIVNGGVF